MLRVIDIPDRTYKEIKRISKLPDFCLAGYLTKQLVKSIVNGKSETEIIKSISDKIHSNPEEDYDYGFNEGLYAAIDSIREFV